MTFRYVPAFFAGIKAMFRAYDDEIGNSPEGLPMLSDWQGHDPYEAYRATSRGAEAPFGALVFLSGHKPGTYVLLSLDRTTVSTACDADVVVRSKLFNEGVLTICREKNALVVRSDQAKAGLAINGHKADSAEIFDQDEIEFLEVKMVYVELEHV